MFPRAIIPYFRALWEIRNGKYKENILKKKDKVNDLVYAQITVNLLENLTKMAKI